MHSFVSKDEVFELAVDCGAPIEFLQGLADLYTVQLDDELTANQEPKVEMAVEFYDQEEIHHNCTVHIWSNSKTGAVSIGWTQDNDEGGNEDEEWYDWRDSR